MDEVSTGGTVISPGVTSSWTENPSEEWVSNREYYSARDYHLMDADSGREDTKQIGPIILTIPRSITSNALSRDF
jgi:hypothetical protein